MKTTHCDRCKQKMGKQEASRAEPNEPDEPVMLRWTIEWRVFEGGVPVVKDLCRACVLWVLQGGNDED
tara:strand:+ start:3949 stop:4152 length:204 start_codon:yes stop_codon:yes gene_type:complete